MKTIREQEEERRNAKLAAIRRKVKSGSLVVREMTAEEREMNRVMPQKDPSTTS
jgi:hypothetical protein